MNGTRESDSNKIAKSVCLCLFKAGRILSMLTGKEAKGKELEDRQLMADGG